MTVWGDVALGRNRATSRLSRRLAWPSMAGAVSLGRRVKPGDDRKGRVRRHRMPPRLRVLRGSAW